MWRLWRVVAALMPWCAVAVSLVLLIVIELRWFPVDTPTAPPMYVRAGQPFVEHDPGGASLMRMSNRAGRVLPPYLSAP